MIDHLKTFIFLFVLVFNVLCMNWSTIDLPDAHLPYYFHSFQHLIDQCLNDDDCPYQEYLKTHEWNRKSCWGYEEGCNWENAYQQMTCPGEHTGWVKNKKSQFETFYAQADFGYIRDQLNGLRIMCEPLFQTDSSLECSEYLRYCRGRNIMMNFTDLLNREDPYRYKIDVLKQGQIGGYCEFHKKRLDSQTQHLSALQSWAPELRYFESLPKRPLESGICDVIVEKPTYIMKIDATINMYHHFCDFFNLYASLHVNASREESFTKDINLLIWETYTYESPFEDTFKAFTTNPILDLKEYKGKVVCFKNLVFPLLPRMIFGLFYNTPIIYGCENSGLFHTFSEFILHRMQIPLYKRANDKIRITLLSRKTKFRNILNEDEIYDTLVRNSDFEVQRVSYGADITFPKQLEITRNTDILIGMHGAGLTHLLFLPNWGAMFEVYNCEDPTCYQDLSRLRGVYYLTWEDETKMEQQDEGHHPEGGAHAKFTNYSFEPEEFVRLVEKAAKHVREHKEFQEFIKKQATEKEVETTLAEDAKENDSVSMESNREDNSPEKNIIPEKDISEKDTRESKKHEHDEL